MSLTTGMEYSGVKETRLTLTEDEGVDSDDFSLQLHANYLVICTEYLRVLDWTTGQLKLVSLMMHSVNDKVKTMQRLRTYQEGAFLTDRYYITLDREYDKKKSPDTSRLQVWDLGSPGLLSEQLKFSTHVFPP